MVEKGTRSIRMVLGTS